MFYEKSNLCKKFICAYFCSMIFAKRKVMAKSKLINKLDENIIKEDNNERKKKEMKWMKIK